MKLRGRIDDASRDVAERLSWQIQGKGGRVQHVLSPRRIVRVIYLGRGFLWQLGGSRLFHSFSPCTASSPGFGAMTGWAVVGAKTGLRGWNATSLLPGKLCLRKMS